MISKNFKIKNKLGIHARPAAEFVKIASKFQSTVYVCKNGHQVNGKSIMGVLMLEAGFGSEIEVQIDGDDEDKAMASLEKLIDKDQFYEE